MQEWTIPTFSSGTRPSASTPEILFGQRGVGGLSELAVRPSACASHQETLFKSATRKTVKVVSGMQGWTSQELRLQGTYVSHRL